MSRVDEARRRAAELVSADGVGGTECLKPLPLTDVARLKIDAFPCEVPEVSGSCHAKQSAVQPSSSTSRAGTGARAPAVQPVDRMASAAWAGTGSWSPPDGLSQKIVSDPHMSAFCREKYRQLAATLHNAQIANGVKVIMIGSAVAGEGKTLTAVNLALTFTESYERRVLLVDADLRQPTLHRLFDGDSTQPVENLRSPAERNLHVRQVTTLLAVLTAESPSSAPMAALTSEQMQRAVKDARDAFDWIVIDTPPVTLLPDASLLAAMVDATVLVLRAESTSLDLVQRAVEAIGKKKIIGIVFNAAPSLSRDFQNDAYDRSGRLTEILKRP
jgi:protein-tyrosine kinase